MLFCRLLIFFRRTLSGMQGGQTVWTQIKPDLTQLVWIQIRPEALSGLIWVQTVRKSYQQVTLGDRVKALCNLHPA